MRQRFLNRLVLYKLLVGILLLIFAGWSFAADDWRAKQKEMFSKIPVEPGDKIDESNYEKVKGLIPHSMVEWVKKGDLPIEVGKFEFDFSKDSEWKEASAKNAGKYELNEKKQFVDNSTGKIPDYIYGKPFPSIDWKNDPNAGIKIMHNFVVSRARVGIWNCNFAVEWIGRAGYEKELVSNYMVYYYWSRPDGPQPNPENYQEMNIIQITAPYGIKGMTTLTRRYQNARADDYYSYMPSIRRVKKLSGANRSDPFAGTDFVNDDSNGWFGKNITMKWKVLDKKIILMPMVNWGLKEPLKARQQPDGSWLVNPNRQPVKEGFTVSGYEGAPWMPVNVKWAPREVYVVQATPKNKYYNYGKQIYYVDPEAGPIYKVIDDTAGEYWKTLMIIPMCVDWGNDPVHRTFGTILWYGIIDDQTDHASTAPCYGNYRGNKFRTKYMDPTIKPGMYTPQMISTMNR